MVWIDETNYNLYCRRKEGRSKIGRRSAVIMPSSKGVILHCIGAITSNQPVLFTTRRGLFKGQDFKEWIRELIEHCNSKGIIRPTVIIDNAPAHSNVEEITNEYDDIQLLRLAPYSYLLNPI